MVFGESVNQFLEQFDLFQVGDGVKRCLFKQGKVFLYDVVAKCMERIDVYFISIRANELEQSFAHGYHTGIRISKAEDVLGTGISVQ